jgi:flagellar biosynthesis protein FliQ
VSELVAVVQQGLGLAILLVLPIVGAALVGSLVASVLATVAGLQDQTAALIARTLAVILAAVLIAEGAATETRTFTSEWWSRLPEIGRDAGR